MYSGTTLPTFTAEERARVIARLDEAPLLICGASGSGKSLFARLVISELLRPTNDIAECGELLARALAFIHYQADPNDSHLATIIMEPQQKPAWREELKRLGDVLRAVDLAWMLKLMDRPARIICGLREPGEIAAVKRTYPQSRVFEICRSLGNLLSYTHNFTDAVIENNGSPEQLRTKASAFIKKFYLSDA